MIATVNGYASLCFLNSFNEKWWASNVRCAYVWHQWLFCGEWLDHVIFAISDVLLRNKNNWKTFIVFMRKQLAQLSPEHHLFYHNFIESSSRYSIFRTECSTSDDNYCHFDFNCMHRANRKKPKSDRAFVARGSSWMHLNMSSHNSI